MNQETKKYDKLWNKNFTILVIVNILSGISMSLTMPMISKYAVFLGATVAFAGMITGMFSVVALVARPFAGAASDRMDKKRLLIVSSLGTAFFNVIAAIAPDANMLFGIRICHGILFGISGTVAMALGTSFVPKNRLGEGVGFLGMSVVVGMAVGPALGAWISAAWGIRVAFLATAAGTALTAVCMIVIPKQPKPQTVGKIPGLNDLVAVEVIPFALFGMITMSTSGVVNGYLLLMGEERAIVGVSLFYTLNAAIMAGSRPLAGKLVDKLGITKTMIPSFICAALTMMILAGAQSLAAVIVAAVFHSFGYGMAHPALNAASIKRIGQERSGVATSTYYIGADVGAGGGPMLAGLLLTFVNYGAMFRVMAVLEIVGLVLFLLYAKIVKIEDATKTA